MKWFQILWIMNFDKWIASIQMDFGPRHRHLSLLNFFDYPNYSERIRDNYFSIIKDDK